MAPLIELRHLRYFLCFSHFTRAAETLYISQPTLSQQIKQLEAELGTTLFDRIGKRVILTEAGEILRLMRSELVELEQAQIAVQELEGLQRGELTVGTVQTVNAHRIWLLVSQLLTQLFHFTSRSCLPMKLSLVLSKVDCI